jgi:hypothetical protein
MFISEAMAQGAGGGSGFLIQIAPLVLIFAVLLGTIAKIEDERIASVEISDNVKVKVVRSTITEVVSVNNASKSTTSKKK